MNYNPETKVLTILPEFNKELTGLPEDVVEIIFEEDSDEVSKTKEFFDNLPSDWKLRNEKIESLINDCISNAHNRKCGSKQFIHVVSCLSNIVCSIYLYFIDSFNLFFKSKSFLLCTIGRSYFLKLFEIVVEGKFFLPIILY